MNKHTLKLLGGRPGELRISAAVLRDAVGALLEGARMATRFAVEGQSVRNGPRPAWLDAACDFEVTGLSPGSTILALEARPLGEVDPTRFGPGAQPSLFGDSGNAFERQTAIDLFGQFLASVMEGEVDEVVADRALLDACAKFARVSGRGCNGIEIEGIHGRSTPLVIRSVDAARMERLRDETPRPQAVRVAGTLDTVSASRPDVVLRMEDGTRVTGRMEAHDLETLRSLLGREVVVSGMAHFGPSRRLLLVDVEALDVARDEDRIFQRVPVARQQKVVLDPAARGDAGGVASFFGTWPGEETDEELVHSLRSLG